MKTFVEYMIENHLHENSLEGDLARDIHTDEGFPKPRKDLQKYHKIILRHLKLMHACEEAVTTFEECWADYLAHMGVKE